MHARRVVSSTLFLVVLCAWCGWVSGFHRSTVPAVATWSVSLATVVAIDLLLWNAQRRRQPLSHSLPTDRQRPRPGQGGSRQVLLGITPWLLIALVALVWEILGIDTGPHEPHLTISALAQAFRGLNAALLLVWMLTGLGFGAVRSRATARETSRAQADGLSGGASAGAAVIATFRPSARGLALLLPHSRAVGVTFWLAWLAAGVLAEGAARRSRGRLASAEDFVRLISGPKLARIALIAAWTFAGWHLFAY